MEIIASLPWDKGKTGDADMLSKAADGWSKKGGHNKTNVSERMMDGWMDAEWTNIGGKEARNACKIFLKENHIKYVLIHQQENKTPKGYSHTNGPLIRFCLNWFDPINGATITGKKNDHRAYEMNYSHILWILLKIKQSRQ